jgi:nucleoside-diphosphate-sugar epimerase
VFGKYQNDKKIIPLICKKMLKNQLIAMTPGEQKRDFIYVDDLVYVIAQVIKNEYKFVGKIVNISYGKSYSLKKIVKFIKRHTGSSSKLDFGSIPYKKNEIMDLRCDISELRSILDINFRYNFFEALVDYINYLKNTL